MKTKNEQDLPEEEFYSIVYEAEKSEQRPKIISKKKWSKPAHFRIQK